MSAGHAVVTGAASGLGAAITAELAEHGWDVTGVDLQADLLTTTLDEIADTWGVTTTAIAGDLANPDFATGFVTTAWNRRPVDGLVNAAGIYPAIPFLEINATRWNRVQAVNVVAPLLATQQLARLAIAAGTSPAIVNIASGAAKRARPGTAHYSTSKAALVMLTKASAIELAPAGIRVNAVAPGFFAVDSAVNPVTDEYLALLSQTVLPGPAQPRYIGSAVRFLLGPDAAWISGGTISVDGGSSAGTRSLPQHWAAPTELQTGTTPSRSKD